ncbi:MAG: 16S rRNA (guanine(527)-N(7))-methyltransferase RsmG, partial [Candidatus Margulisbacteria bacterium]|nr:16S rRNA (guanine(527)-N(7))-methyltransferase RsmG [Candidatus Margulisiibacteriota bacterium]
DSLSLLQVLKLTTQSIIDIGSGAGFPGLPLKLACPQIKLTLLEATRKKVEFLKHLVLIFSLQDVEIIAGRAEEVVKEKRESFDLAIARAVAQLNVLSEYCLPFVKLGGLFVAYKEAAVESEVDKALKGIALLGGKLREIKKVRLPDSEIIRSLVVIEKISPTPAKFPRRAGLAKKRPLQ